LCLIAVCQSERLAPVDVRDAVDANPDGNGAAWLEDGRVRWMKGITDEEMFEFAATMPLPHILHVRFSTIGGTPASLCHPFPFGGDLALEGSTKQGVLFHNGHWGEWNTVMLKSLPSPRSFPRGPWSDSRAMAWLVKQYGPHILDLVGGGQRVALLTPKGVQRWGNGWVTEKGILLSSTQFRMQRYVYRSPGPSTTAPAQSPSAENNRGSYYYGGYGSSWRDFGPDDEDDDSQRATRVKQPSPTAGTLARMTDAEFAAYERSLTNE